MSNIYIKGKSTTQRLINFFAKSEHVTYVISIIKRMSNGFLDKNTCFKSLENPLFTLVEGFKLETYSVQF